MAAIVIGGGPAGLAVAACLGRRGIAAEIFERGPAVGMAWRGHYDRLHLHTSRRRSGLPFRPMPRSFGLFPARDDVIGYLEDYARAEGLSVHLGREVRAVMPADGGWRVVHSDGEDTARDVVFATGTNAEPRRPSWPGLQDFPGAVLHSSDYRNATGFAGKRVLVVGFGNSGADIALDLAEGGAQVLVSVRGPVNIVPSTILGYPSTSLGGLGRVLGPKNADRIAAPLARLLVGRPEDYGFKPPTKGPTQQILEDRKIPMIDVGALAAIRAGKIGVRPGLERFEGGKAVFEDGSETELDALVLATGYRVDLRPLLPGSEAVLDTDGRPLVSGGPCGLPGLWFCSYHVPPSGQFRQACIEARALARLIGARG